jgi:hypothetical protein
LLDVDCLTLSIYYPDSFLLATQPCPRQLQRTYESSDRPDVNLIPEGGATTTTTSQLSR